MKKIFAGIILAGCALGPQIAAADNHTVSLGYAHSKVEDARSIDGINLQYRYEWNSPLSILASFSYLKGDNSDAYHDAWGDSYKYNVDMKYYSLLAGPAYRINDYLSFYGLLGVAHAKAEGSYKWRNSVGADGQDGHLNINASSNATSFAYAAGVVINPVDYLSVNIGYEGTRVDLDKERFVNGFNVGIGYRF